MNFETKLKEYFDREDFKEYLNFLVEKKWQEPSILRYAMKESWRYRKELDDYLHGVVQNEYNIQGNARYHYLIAVLSHSLKTLTYLKSKNKKAYEKQRINDELLYFRNNTQHQDLDYDAYYEYRPLQRLSFLKKNERYKNIHDSVFFSKEKFRIERILVKSYLKTNPSLNLSFFYADLESFKKNKNKQGGHYIYLREIPYFKESVDDDYKREFEAILDYCEQEKIDLSVFAFDESFEVKDDKWVSQLNKMGVGAFYKYKSFEELTPKRIDFLKQQSSFVNKVYIIHNPLEYWSHIFHLRPINETIKVKIDFPSYFSKYIKLHSHAWLREQEVSMRYFYIERLVYEIDQKNKQEIKKVLKILSSDMKRMIHPSIGGDIYHVLHKKLESIANQDESIDKMIVDYLVNKESGDIDIVFKNKNVIQYLIDRCDFHQNLNNVFDSSELKYKVLRNHLSDLRLKKVIKHMVYNFNKKDSLWDKTIRYQYDQEKASLIYRKLKKLNIIQEKNVSEAVAVLDKFHFDSRSGLDLSCLDSSLIKKLNTVPEVYHHDILLGARTLYNKTKKNIYKTLAKKMTKNPNQMLMKIYPETYYLYECDIEVDVLGLINVLKGKKAKSMAWDMLKYNVQVEYPKEKLFYLELASLFDKADHQQRFLAIKDINIYIFSQMQSYVSAIKNFLALYRPEKVFSMMKQERFWSYVLDIVKAHTSINQVLKNQNQEPLVLEAIDLDELHTHLVSFRGKYLNSLDLGLYPKDSLIAKLDGFTSLDGQYELRVPTNIKELITNGKEMSNCIAGEAYIERILKGESILFNITCDGTHKASVEIRDKNIFEQKGYKNSAINPSIALWVKGILQDLKMIKK